LDAYHTSTRDVAVALVRIYNACLKCAARGSLKIQYAKNRQKSPSMSTIAQVCPALYIFATKARIDNRKKLLKQQYLLHNMATLCPLPAEISSGVWGTPTNLNGFRILPSLLHYCSDVAHRMPTKLCTMFGRLLGSPGDGQTSCIYNVHIQYTSCIYNAPAQAGLVHCIYIFGGSCVQVFRSPVLAALLHGTPAATVNQTLRPGTRNGTTELSQRAPPIFSLVVITLGIGPHSSF